MGQANEEKEPVETFPSDADIDAVLHEFSGDHRAAIRALLADLDTLAVDRNGNVSFGFVYGRLVSVRRRDR